MTDYTALLESKKVTDLRPDSDIILEGQYKDAYDAMLDAYHAGLYVGLIGPVGSGKTALCRRFAQDLKRPFDWVTFSDLVRPSNLIGSFDPTLSSNTVTPPKRSCRGRSPSRHCKEASSSPTK